jgi:hypothetical protein
MTAQRSLGLVVVALAAVAALASFLKAFDAIRTELESRKTSLATATDRTSKRQYAAVVKALAAIDKFDAAGFPGVDATAKAAAKFFPGLEKAFPAEFPRGLAPTGALGTAMSAVAASLRSTIEAERVPLTTAIGTLPAGKPKSAAQAQADAAGKALGAADVATTPSKIAKLAKTALAAITRGLAIAAKASAHDTVTATIGTAAYSGRNNSLYYTASGGVFTLTTNSTNAALGGFASFTFSPSATNLTGPGDYPITGTMATGADPGNDTTYDITSGTLHLTTFDLAGRRATGTFTLTVAGHPERSSADGAFDFRTIRVH